MAIYDEIQEKLRIIHIRNRRQLFCDTLNLYLECIKDNIDTDVRHLSLLGREYEVSAVRMDDKDMDKWTLELEDMPGFIEIVPVSYDWVIELFQKVEIVIRADED